MVTPLPAKSRPIAPVFEVRELGNESDVEQKLILPFLLNASYLGLRNSWVRTKEYMSPTEIDKAAGKRYGYVPDYSIWIDSIPLFIVEAKAPDVAIQVALREARLYAGEINKRYPPGVNPIGFILACNGVEFGFSPWDSEVDTVIALCADVQPGTQLLDIFVQAIGHQALQDRAKKLGPHFQKRPFYDVASFMGGQSRVAQQLGVNDFAEPLFSTIAKYFGSNSDETPDDVIDRAYVASDEISTYEGVLETYLKDRTAQIAGNQLRPIDTSKNAATGISTEVQRFSQNPNANARVQLIVGSVGAGKSTFIRRFYRRLMSGDIAKKTRWAFLNFNVMPPGLDGLKLWIAEQFIKSFAAVNEVDIYEADQIEKIFGAEIRRFERGPAKALYNNDRSEFVRRRTSLLDDLTKDAVKLSECIARHFSGEMHLGLVVVFDNVDKRSRDQQLAIFEAAQWFKELTKALVLVNLRDSTFEAHRDEPPLDAFINAINFYIRPPRFAQVIRKRLELVLENLQSEVSKRQEYSLASGYKIHYPATKLGSFLLSIYLSLFDDRSVKVAGALEALVAKDVRRALGMFGDIIVSPHIPTSQITTTVLGGEQRIQENRIIRALMRGRYKYYNGGSLYIRNVLYANPEYNRPSNLLIPDMLEFLIRNRKSKIDFAQEGYATVGTLIKKMSQLGYDEADISRAVATVVEWGLVEPESLVPGSLLESDAVRMHASGFIHMRFFLERNEYLLGLTTNLQFASREVSSEIGRIWAGQSHLPDLHLSDKLRIMAMLRDHMKFEYVRRCRRHAFYEENGLGGRIVVESLERATRHLESTFGPKGSVSTLVRRSDRGYAPGGR
ncbi:MAG TPA: type I restriction endonuclease [Pseudolabrys sp.]|nr:type I restriction endonuclease [Pseudolabrys sp.]